MMINKQTAFANNQVFALFYLRDIRRTVLPQKLCMEMPCWCPFEGHKYGPSGNQQKHLSLSFPTNA